MALHCPPLQWLLLALLSRCARHTDMGCTCACLLMTLFNATTEAELQSRADKNCCHTEHDDGKGCTTAGIHAPSVCMLTRAPALTQLRLQTQPTRVASQQLSSATRHPSPPSALTTPRADSATTYMLRLPWHSSTTRFPTARTTHHKRGCKQPPLLTHCSTNQSHPSHPLRDT
jgi:hypothetical protein